MEFGGWELLLLVLVVLLLAAVLVLLRRSRRIPSGSHGPAPPDPDQVAAELAALRTSVRRETEQERDSILLLARTAADEQAAQVLERARTDAERERSHAVQAAQQAAERERDGILGAVRQQSVDQERRDQRLSEREQRLDGDEDRLRTRGRELSAAQRALAEAEAQLQSGAEQHAAETERIAGLTAAEAKAELLAGMQQQLRRDSGRLIRDIEVEARAEGEQRARAIVAEAIQRVASEQTAESVVSVLHLPGDEMKGRIIGREGRNIRTFEAVTGVNLIIDDTPEAVLLSCFDPVRREVGRLTLDALVADGRIHPHRIEEVYERSKLEVEALCERAGQDAILDVGIGEVHPELVTLLGRLRYRTSYGQNVLKHLIETAHIAGVMAAELRVDGRLLKRAAFLHDIGKALTHEVEGSHAIIGADLARRYGEHEDVVHAIEAHHNEVLPQTIEAVLTQASDSCSGGRPGARRESVESYVKRLERIEQIAAGREGVDKVFAMQAGREIRIMVAPDRIDDLEAHVLAREVAKQIEDELTYPGQIRVTVVRESRASEIAH